MTAPVPPRPRRGVLVVVAGLLIASAVFRIGSGVGEAWATAAPTGTFAETTTPKASDQQCYTEDDIAALLDTLSTREQVAQEQEDRIAVRMASLAAADAEIARRLAALAEAEDRLRSTIQITEEASETDIARLVAVYEAMKPKDAATLFSAMDPGFAAGFLGRMKPEIAAGIMAGLDSQVAYSISAVLAGRNANAPRE